MKFNHIDTSDPEDLDDLLQPTNIREEEEGDLMGFKVPAKRNFFNELASRITVSKPEQITIPHCPIDQYCSFEIKEPYSHRLKTLLQDYNHAKIMFEKGQITKASLQAKRNAVCTYHHAECTIIPQGISLGYRDEIDFESIPDRLTKYQQRLQKIVKREITSKFRQDYLKTYKSLGKFKAKYGQLNGSDQLCGYYGWVGISQVLQILQIRFKKLKYSDIEPQTKNDFLQFVLAPESICCLIAEDYGWNINIKENYERALEILTKSSEFGHILHSDI